MKNKHLILKKSAPDSVGISQGVEFNKTFKRENEPFSVNPDIADMLLRSHDEYFMEAPEEKAAETPAKVPAKVSKKKPGKKAAVPEADESTSPVDPNAVFGEDETAADENKKGEVN